ncbi:NAD(P)-binding protein [Polyporus arcularius HHB13444]|uniref:NAD(P)-binding protein n=1 Tax=Polyporus arcularius HHB13444 TaxID=1314778 RepID=A0A5C3NTK2_9APHY|nr:NAD(P)-binding protein [Polyporus arcularius HHB13444]
MSLEIATSPPCGPVGVARALAATELESSAAPPTPTLFTHEFSLSDRVALVTGGNRGIGLEAALTFAEAGARAVYCIDLPEQPGKEFMKLRTFFQSMDLSCKLEYWQGDVRDQKAMWKLAEHIGNCEGRLDVCVPAAGTADIGAAVDFPGKEFQEVMDVNVNGVLFTAQAAARQMARFGNGGSIVMIASICGRVAMEGLSKAAVLQMARTMACELAPQRIRVNTISPGFVTTKMTAWLEQVPELGAKGAAANPMGRIGRPDELRGALAFLASDASSFCTGSDIVIDGGHCAW